MRPSAKGTIARSPGLKVQPIERFAVRGGGCELESRFWRDCAQCLAFGGGASRSRPCPDVRIAAAFPLFFAACFTSYQLGPGYSRSPQPRSQPFPLRCTPWRLGAMAWEFPGGIVLRSIYSCSFVVASSLAAKLQARTGQRCGQIHTGGALRGAFDRLAQRLPSRPAASAPYTPHVYGPAKLSPAVAASLAHRT
jgi:hypothetical protein